MGWDIVFDPSVFGQVAKELVIAQQQLDQALLLVDRMGDPASFTSLSGARGLLNGLAEQGVGQSLGELRATFSGLDGIRFDNQGLYRLVTEQIVSASGDLSLRLAQDYGKFDAINKATANYRIVREDTEIRRRQGLQDLRITSAQMQAATTDAEVQKSQALISAQATMLNATDRERDDAFHNAMIQDLENRNDERKQAQAREEDSTADFQSAHRQLGRVLIPNSAVSAIPDPRFIRRVTTTTRPVSRP